MSVRIIASLAPVVAIPFPVRPPWNFACIQLNRVFLIDLTTYFLLNKCPIEQQDSNEHRDRAISLFFRIIASVVAGYCLNSLAIPGLNIQT